MVGSGEKWVGVSQFARMLDDPVSPPAVDKWIKGNKLPSEFVREKEGGRGKLISTEALPIANAMRCPGQSLGTAEGNKARSDFPPDRATSIPDVAGSPLQSLPRLDAEFSQTRAESDAERYQRARADQAEQAARDGLRKAAEQEGRLLCAVSQAAAWRKVSGEIIDSLEAALPEMAEELYAAHPKDPREMRAVLRDQIRAWRTMMAKHHADIAATLPEQNPVALAVSGEEEPGNDTTATHDPGAEPRAISPVDLGGSP